VLLFQNLSYEKSEAILNFKNTIAFTKSDFIFCKSFFNP